MIVEVRPHFVAVECAKRSGGRQDGGTECTPPTGAPKQFVANQVDLCPLYNQGHVAARPSAHLKAR